MESVITHIVDILLAVLLIAAVYSSARKGFIKSVFNALAYLASALIASKLNSPLSQLFYDKLLQPRITEKVAEKLTGELDISNAMEYADALIENIPGIIIKAAEKMHIDLNYISVEFSEQNFAPNEIVDKLVEYIAEPVVVSVINFFMFFALFIIFLLMIKFFIIKLLERRIRKSPFQKGDKLVGAALGLVKGAVIVILLCVVLDFLAGISEGSKLAEYVGNSYLISKIATNNFIINIFKA